MDYGEQGEPRFERAALRWLGRLFLEKPMPSKVLFSSSAAFRPSGFQPPDWPRA